MRDIIRSDYSRETHPEKKPVKHLRKEGDEVKVGISTTLTEHNTGGV